MIESNKKCDICHSEFKEEAPDSFYISKFDSYFGVWLGCYSLCPNCGLFLDKWLTDNFANPLSQKE